MRRSLAPRIPPAFAKASAFAKRFGGPVRRPASKQRTLKSFQSRLTALDPSAWTVDQQVDRALTGALMNGLDFDLRVLRPWERA